MKGRPHLIPALIAAFMLLAAVFELPYGYYQFLRWVICGASVYIVIRAVVWNKTWAAWLFGAVAILFNPIIPIHLSKEIWQPIDLVGAIFFGISIVILKEPPEKQSD